MIKKAKNMDEYVESFPIDRQKILRKMRGIIRKAAPDAEEVISYGIPAFKIYGGVAVYFAAFKDHIGFFPTSSGVKKFKDELKEYKTSKGTIKIPLDKPLPADLISKIVKFRVEEILESE